jgi:D-glucosaminate-6-phosphate ammonia-lyase
MRENPMNPLKDRLKIQPIINGVGPATRLGGLPLSDFVQKSMRESLENNFRMEELHIASSDFLSDLLNVEAALITNSASASLTLATAACLTGMDSKKVVEIPNFSTFEKNIVIQKAHRDPYDHALTMLVSLKEAGFPSGCHKIEVKHALDENTVAGLWRAGIESDAVGLGEFVEICHSKNVPVIVDAALVIPPLDRLEAMINTNVDFIAISGGKGFRGPQASGLLITKKQYFNAALLNHLDLDEREATWPAGLLGTESIELPRNGVARGMKVGREQIFGLLAAVIENVENNRDCIEIAELEICLSLLEGFKKINISKSWEINLEVPTLHIHPPKDLSVDDFFMKLSNGTPRIVLGQEFTRRGFLTLNPMALQSGQGKLIAEQIIKIAEEVIRK